MEKIPTCLERDWEGDRSRVLNQIAPGCEWVFNGEGVATRKVDGTCVMYDGTIWWARREVKDDREPPANFVAVSTDLTTGKTIGWEPIDQSPFAKFWNEAVDFTTQDGWDTGTYELLGPKIQKNPENLTRHELWKHEYAEQASVDRSFEGMKSFLEERG